MKKITFLTLLLFTISLQAQIKVVETKPSEEVGVVKTLFDTSMKTVKQGDVYTILYRDNKYQKITDFKSFSMNEQSFNELYDLILKNYKNPPEDDIMIDLPMGGYIWLNYTSIMGVTSFRFIHSVDKNAAVMGYSKWLTERQLKKLFGK